MRASWPKDMQPLSMLKSPRLVLQLRRQPERYDIAAPHTRRLAVEEHNVGCNQVGEIYIGVVDFFYEKPQYSRCAYGNRYGKRGREGIEIGHTAKHRAVACVEALVLAIVEKAYNIPFRAVGFDDMPDETGNLAPESTGTIYRYIFHNQLCPLNASIVAAVPELISARFITFISVVHTTLQSVAKEILSTYHTSSSNFLVHDMALRPWH